MSWVSSLRNRFGGDEQYRVVTRRELSDKEAEDLPRGKAKDRPSCAGGCGQYLTLADGGYSNSQQFTEETRRIVRFGGGLYHKHCEPATQTWQEIASDGGKAAFSGIRGGMAKHPYITAAIATSFVAGVVFLFLSRGTIDTICFRDAANKNIAWCADSVGEDGLKVAEFQQFQGVKDWVPSGSFATKTFEEVSSGTMFIYNSVSKFFLHNPFKIIASAFVGD